MARKKPTGDEGNVLDICKVASGYLATLNNALIDAMEQDIVSREERLEACKTAKAVKRKKVAKQLSSVEKLEVKSTKKAKNVNVLTN